jgi:hypothetical protein
MMLAWIAAKVVWKIADMKHHYLLHTAIVRYGLLLTDGDAEEEEGS